MTSSTQNIKEQSRQLLVKMLQEASQLEHSLLNSYLYAACSLKSTPQEFESIDGQTNCRRAIHFEKARVWKQTILKIASEEMLHLHYVQCLLRGLGESPYFHLPNRSEAGHWVIPNWSIRIDGQTGPETKTEIPIAGISQSSLKNFILFESTDSLQDSDVFKDENMKLFEQLRQFEFDFRLESILLDQPDDTRSDLKKELIKIYDTTLPGDASRKKMSEAFVAKASAELPELEKMKFQSIADFYLKGISPLYNQAFEFGWVKHNNIDLNLEQQNPDYAAEGFLPIGPVYRSKNFENFAAGNMTNPLANYKHVNDIVREIVEEGEGHTNFLEQASAFLGDVQKLGSTRAYLLKYLDDYANRRNPAFTSEPIVQLGESLRKSHLYRFVVTYMDLKIENDLCEAANIDFNPCRSKIDVGSNTSLKNFVTHASIYFNSGYLVLLAWLARIYEVREWHSDKQERFAIEMLASWPLMSICVRPFLELISALDIDSKKLFLITQDSLPMLPVEAQQLYLLFSSNERTEEINETMDYLAVKVLSNISIWAKGNIPVIENAEIEDEIRAVVVNRLKTLSTLDEFEKQFPFREEGGYSNRFPSVEFVNKFPDADQYSEDPSKLDALFEDSLVLKINFSGFGLVQLSTDPDPPLDESGCSGTHMFHAADGNKKFDRSLVWQNTDKSHDIIRGPAASLPPVGVKVRDVSIMVTDHASAGYTPMQIMQSAGAVQTSGVQQQLSVEGLFELFKFSDGPSLGIRLDEKNGARPYLYGDNHLVWRDGEPIDPFIISITDESHQPILFREIFNKGKSMPEMSPLERLLSSRAPVGFDSYTNLPDWVAKHLPESYIKLLQSPRFPVSYLKQRAAVLGEELINSITDSSGNTQTKVDSIISLSERMFHVSTPRGTTVAWLTFLLHYGHTISGTQWFSDNLLFNSIKNKTGLDLKLIEEADRTKPNSRWLIKYTKGIMDTDAITDLVYGELYIPVEIKKVGEKVRLPMNFTFNRKMVSFIREFCLSFSKPFWSTYNVNGNIRTTQFGTQLITETLISSTDLSYVYSIEGLEEGRKLIAEFSITEDDNTASLNWNVNSVTGENVVPFLFAVKIWGQIKESIRGNLMQVD